jgi:hypothetical protein
VQAEIETQGVDEEEKAVEKRVEEVGNDAGNDVGKEVEEEVATGAVCILDPRASCRVNRGRAFRCVSSRSLSGFALLLACISNSMRVLDASGSVSKRNRGRGSTAD